MSDAVKPDPSDECLTREEALVLEFEFDAPPAKVWRAVTIPELRERWLPGCDLAGTEPETSIPGEEVRYRMRESEPPFRESEVIFKIEPNVSGGTRFRIIQQACVTLPQPANSNCCVMRAAA
ncbi:SRPBCC domain-containing protein [Bradyrhizobium sp. INPA01-394B]|uniref:SRPBCC domain-containing protein n=1 Tax=Bradyrhizobium campsiandrae TaxID=1729892 RepID=A0ABR7U172_9BRAD|nr:SRPBCC domain-containing protein [Bradyrhizobium campsiandrae]MBC9882649.1 SRPBCC domain-containing protein [Bradyrhizobium campsiandrae]MBC9977553.1 SRPBCC domain-containing protein [Bradyrhizobium campsiandrae]